MYFFEDKGELLFCKKGFTFGKAKVSAWKGFLVLITEYHFKREIRLLQPIEISYGGD